MKLTFLHILFLLADKEKEKLLSELKHYRKTFMRMEVRILLINRFDDKPRSTFPIFKQGRQSMYYRFFHDRLSVKT